MAVQVGKAAIFNGCSDSQALRARSRGRSYPAFFEAVEAEQNAALLAQQLNQKKTQCDEGQELQYQAAVFARFPSAFGKIRALRSLSH